MVHLVRCDIRHPVRVVDDFFRLRIQPAVAFDQSDAVCRSAADPRLTDKIRIACQCIGILRELCFKETLGQHMTERSPHIAPMLLISMERVLHQIVGVLASRVREAGRVQLGAAAAISIIDLDRAARCAGPVAAVGIARDHRVDVRGVFLVLVSDGSAELRREVFIRCRQRERHSGSVGFFLLYNASVLQLNGHSSYSLFRDKKAVHKPVCRTLTWRGLAKTEGIKNRLDLYRVKTIAVGHIRVGFRHRRIQKRKSGTHLLDMIPEFCGYFCRVAHTIEGRSYRLVVVIRTSGSNGAQECDEYNDWRENCDQRPSHAFAQLFVREHCRRGFCDHACRYCHQRPPAVPNSFSLYEGACTSNR